ncbi:TetR/AcrR family transcriptional regulator [Microlunatus flavus]|uniref:Regulatory protein, tetR family n=1 Tax=Microlunatus flavus TaxID=1036181 RepID=A0A1H9MJ14_9ACTN|nr:TetR/AcrR family transcriptional regulator [Microlunatus flavus]SER23700.1 regulatory protein, tetR family [Microlunatus flavus]
MPRASLSTSAVVAAGAELADEVGFEVVTLSAVARRLGVQTASLYNHVRDRAELLAGLHELALGELADRIADAVAGKAGRDALIGLAEAQRTFAREHPGRWAALQQPASPTTAVSNGAVRVATLTMAVLRGYDVPEVELVHATRFLGATVNGFLALERSGGFAHREPGTEASWQRTLTALDAVVRAWPTTLDGAPA